MAEQSCDTATSWALPAAFVVALTDGHKSVAGPIVSKVTFGTLFCRGACLLSSRPSMPPVNACFCFAVYCCSCRSCHAVALPEPSTVNRVTPCALDHSELGSSLNQEPCDLFFW